MVEYLRKIGFGMITNLFYTIATVLGAIITVPLFIRSVGSVYYGLFVAISSVVGFVGLSDFGVTSAVTNKISYLFVEKKHKEISELFSGSVLFLLVLSVLFLILIFFSIDLLSVKIIFGVGEDMLTTATYLFLVLLIFSSINVFLGGVINSFYRGLNELPRYNVVQTVYVLIYSLAFIIFLLFSPGVLSIALFQGLFTVLRIIIFFLAAKLLWFKWLKFELNFRLTVKVFPLLKYSVEFFILSICNSLIGKTDYLVISHILGVGQAAVFSIVDKIFRLPAQSIQVAGASTPSIACLFKLGEQTGLVKLYSKVLRMHMILRLGVLFFLLVFSREIITVWVGGDFFGGYFLATSFFINYILYTWIGTHVEFLNAMFKQRFLIYPIIISTAINLVVSILLANKVGLLGVVIGTILGNFLTTAIYLPIVLRRQIPIRPGVELLKMIVTFILPAGFLLFVAFIIISVIDSYFYRLLIGCISGVPYVYLIFKLMLSSVEQKYFIQKFRKYLFTYV